VAIEGESLIKNGWYARAKHIPSPNFNDRPDCNDISLLVVHNISLPPGEFGSCDVENFFLNQLDSNAHPYFQQIASLRVSAHCFIRRDGQIIQFVAFGKRAWHAGRSTYDGRPECNDYSIGVELEGTDITPYTEQQYKALAELTVELIKEYPLLNKNRITGHSDIAPGRKTDPGPAFDWQYFGGLLRHEASLPE